MINTAAAQIEGVCIHSIGSKSDNEGITLSDKPIDLSDDYLKDLLLSYFLKNFKDPEFYGFTFSNDDFTLNPLFTFARAIFTNPNLLHNQSIFIAKHLYEQSTHPNIKTGDLMVVYLKDIVVEENMVDAVGIFKSENKNTFLKLLHNNKQFELNYEEGIQIDKLDKACLILNEEETDGYKICIVDKSNKQNEAQYWLHDFLNVREKNDDYNNTKHFIDLTKSFIEERLIPKFEIEKYEQAGILNRSKEYFKRTERFEEEDYEDRIFFSNKDIIDEFKDYKEEFKENSQFDLDNQFFVSPKAFKKNARFLRSIIKIR
ncbi:MAG: nucleoid-associated protein [Chitinophagales bacterium]|nr:nucleoid-associated protein [Chitinophagales bacterium]